MIKLNLANFCDYVASLYYTAQEYIDKTYKVHYELKAEPVVFSDSTLAHINCYGYITIPFNAPIEVPSFFNDIRTFVEFYKKVVVLDDSQISTDIDETVRSIDVMCDFIEEEMVGKFVSKLDEEEYNYLWECVGCDI